MVNFLDVVLPLWSGPVPPGDRAAVRPHPFQPPPPVDQEVCCSWPGVSCNKRLDRRRESRSIRMTASQSRLAGRRRRTGQGRAMSKVGAATFAIFILLAVVFGFVDDFRLVMALIVHDQWTVGSYLHPVWTPLEVTSGVVCALLVLGFAVGATRARLRRESIALFEAKMGGFLVLLVAGAV